MNELISIVVPVYNVDKCIESIINQSYSNLEIILVDDGSKDSSGIMCDSYILKDKRIKVIHKENGGLSDARNVGIDKAKGEYIVFIDSDDWIDEKMIEILYNIIKKNNSDISICDYFLAYNEEIQTQKEDIEIINLSNIEALKKIYDKDLGVCMIVAWNKLYKRNLFKDDIRYPYGKIHEDEFTTYKLLYKAEKISYTKQKMYYYRQRENSITSSFNKKRLDCLEAFDERVKYMKYIVEKGRVTLDGASLTVMKLGDTTFGVSLIPHTQEMITLGKRRVGDYINVETDLIGKYIERFMKFQDEPSEKKEGITMEFLMKNGF